MISPKIFGKLTKTNMPKKTEVTDIIGQPIKFHVFAFEPNLGLKGKNIAVG